MLIVAYWKGKKVTVRTYLELKYKDRPVTLGPKLKQLEEKIKAQKEKKLRYEQFLERKKEFQKLKKQKEKSNPKTHGNTKIPLQICPNCGISFSPRKRGQLFHNWKCYIQFKNNKPAKMVIDILNKLRGGHTNRLTQKVQDH